MYNYTEKDVRIMSKSKMNTVHFYPEYIAKAQQADYDSLFEYVSDLYDEHLSFSKVGSIIGVSRGCVRKWIKSMGRKTRARGGNVMPPYREYAEGDEKLSKRIRYYPKHLDRAREEDFDSLTQCIKLLRKQGQTIKTIAEILLVDPKTVRNWLNIIKSPTKGGAN